MIVITSSPSLSGSGSLASPVYATPLSGSVVAAYVNRVSGSASSTFLRKNGSGSKSSSLVSIIQKTVSSPISILT